MKIDTLTNIACKKAKCPDGKDAIRLNDGLGLYLYIKKTQTKSWYLRYSFNGKKVSCGLGGFPDVTLKEARDRRASARRLLREGIDPKIHIEKQKKRKTLESVNYDKYRLQYIKEKLFAFMSDRKNIDKPWSQHHVIRTDALWNNYIVPQGYANMSITEITEDEVVEILQYVLNNPLNLESGKYDREKYSGRNTMSKVKTLMNQLFDHSKHILRLKQSNGKPIENPVTQLKGNPLLRGLNQHQQFKSIDIEQIGEYWHKVRTLGNTTDKIFMMISVVTALRVGSQIRLTWNMFDKFKKGLNIPKEFMKNKKPFTTPLPDDIVDLLVKLKSFMDPEDDSEFIFKGRLKNSHYLQNRPRILIKQLGYDATAHGHRTLFKDINEIQGHSNIAIEFQLSHSSGTRNKVENAYVKASNYREKRRELVVGYFNHLEKEADQYVKLMKISKNSKVSVA